MKNTQPQSKEMAMLFYNISRMLYHIGQYHSPEIKLTIEQLQALIFICENKSVRMNDLAKFLGISAATATALINRLITNGWIIREEGVKDRRVVNISLQIDGKAKLRKILSHKMQALNAALDTLNKNEKEHFFKTLKKLENDLPNKAYGHVESHEEIQNGS